MFVIDGLCTHDQLEDTRREIHGAIKHPDLQTLPWMILCNKQDLEGASTHHKVCTVGGKNNAGSVNSDHPQVVFSGDRSVAVARCHAGKLQHYRKILLQDQ